MKTPDEKELTALFYRFEALKRDIDHIKAIVQNVMVVSSEELTSWNQRQALPTLVAFNQLIQEVNTFYSNITPCVWCGEKHVGGPEHCRN